MTVQKYLKIKRKICTEKNALYDESGCERCEICSYEDDEPKVAIEIVQSYGKIGVARMERRSASTVASMPFQASAPAKSVEMFIEESHGTTGARNTRYGDAAPGWNMVPANVMHLPFRKQICKRQL